MGAPVPSQAQSGRSLAHWARCLPFSATGGGRHRPILTSAPAAADTIRAHLLDTGRTLEYYDLIITGDLGDHGTDMMRELLIKNDIDVAGRHVDCGSIVFGQDQDVHAGGSGCGCCAVTLGAHFLPGMQRGEYARLLVVATGALLSTSSSMQGESIPGISHAVVLERSV